MPREDREWLASQVAAPNDLAGVADDLDKPCHYDPMREQVGIAAVFAVVYAVVSYFVTGGELVWLIGVVPFAFTTHFSAAILGAIYARPPRKR
jgi:hypothetical protein